MEQAFPAGPEILGFQGLPHWGLIRVRPSLASLGACLASSHRLFPDNHSEDAALVGTGQAMGWRWTPNRGAYPPIEDRRARPTAAPQTL